ncbi:MAG: hypothetical protein IID17_04435 [Nitrospinae bacterium]|nr:hypothetical protein [Nitrospinota bacterium]
MTESLRRTQRELFAAQARIASGRAFVSASENPIAAGRVLDLRSAHARQDQFVANLRQGANFLGASESAMLEINELLIEAGAVASQNVSNLTSAEEREAESVVIAAIREQIVAVGNRSLLGRFIFGGRMTTDQPFRSALGGVAYVGDTAELVTRVDDGLLSPISTPGNLVFGALSESVSNGLDLSPPLTETTRLDDINGIDRTRLESGTLVLNEVGGTGTIHVDLSDAETLGDVVTLINEASSSGTAGYSAALGAAGLEITPGALPLSITDTAGGAIAASLGRTGVARSAVVVLGATIFTFVIAVSPSPASVDSAGRFRSIGDEISSLADEQIDRGTGGLRGRSEIWRTALSLIVNPKVPQEEPRLKTLLRPVYGLGPDMFVHSYPLAVSPRSVIELQANAHNLPLHIFVTAGLLGLISLAAVFAGLILIAKRLFSGLRKHVPRDSLQLILASVFLAAFIGKSIEMQTGVPRVSDLTPALVVLGAVLASYALTVSGPVPIARPDSSRLSDRATASLGGRLMMIGLGMMGILLMTSIFIGWDVRRLGSTAILTNSSNLVSPIDAGESYLEAHRRAPDRQSVTYTLYESYFTTSATLYADGRSELAQSLILRARELWLDAESRNPYELGAQLALAKIAATMVERGHSEFSSELLERYSRIAEYYPGYPTLTGTAATAAASVGEYEFAIELANNAIKTENRTHGWSKAWFARGISRFLLGLEDEGISDLIVATEKQPGTQGARLAHLALAKIYRDRGDLDRAEIHETKALE